MLGLELPRASSWSIQDPPSPRNRAAACMRFGGTYSWLALLVCAVKGQQESSRASQQAQMRSYGNRAHKSFAAREIVVGHGWRSMMAYDAAE